MLKVWAGSVFLERMQAAPGAHGVLQELAASYRLALVSNHTTDIQLRKVQRLGFEGYFSAIITSEEVGVEKPHARIFERALTALRCDASEAVMVGDDPDADLRGAKELSIGTVRTVQFATRSPQEGAPDAVVQSLAELPAILGDR